MLTEQVSRNVGQERLIAVLTGGFGLLALGLAGFGLFGVMSFVVARRTSEIGLRLALGAQRARVLWMVLRESLLPVTLGLAVGLPSVFAVSRLLAGMLFGLTATDLNDRRRDDDARHGSDARGMCSRVAGLAGRSDGRAAARIREVRLKPDATYPTRSPQRPPSTQSEWILGVRSELCVDHLAGARLVSALRRTTYVVSAFQADRGRTHRSPSGGPCDGVRLWFRLRLRMHRLVSALVLSIALSGATGDWLDHWGHFLACGTNRDDGIARDIGLERPGSAGTDPDRRGAPRRHNQRRSIGRDRARHGRAEPRTPCDHPSDAHRPSSRPSAPSYLRAPDLILFGRRTFRPRVFVCVVADRGGAMSGTLRVKLFVSLVVLVVFGAIGVYPIVAERYRFPAPKWLKDVQLKRGLDLQGGVHLVLRVRTEEALRAETATEMERLREEIAKRGVGGVNVTQPDPNPFPRRRVSPAQEATLREAAHGCAGEFRSDAGAGGTYVFTMKPNVQVTLREMAVAQDRESIERRVNELGVTEPSIARQGRDGDEIVVQLPASPMWNAPGTSSARRACSSSHSSSGGRRRASRCS